MIIQQYVIFGALGLMILWIAFYVGRRKRKASVTTATISTTSPAEPLPDPIECYVFDRTNRQCYDYSMPSEQVKKVMDTYSILGRQINRKGKMVYYFVRIAKDDYKPYDFYYTLDRQYSPAYLYDKINLPEMELTHDAQVTRSLMDKYGHLLPWTVAMAFIMFMMIKG